MGWWKSLRPDQQEAYAIIGIVAGLFVVTAAVIWLFVLYPNVMAGILLIAVIVGFLGILFYYIADAIVDWWKYR